MDLQAADLELGYTENQVRKDKEIFSQWEIQESIVSAALARYRTENLQHKGGLQEDFSRTELKILNVEQQKAESEINLARETLSALELKSPASGVVLHWRSPFWSLEVGAEAWPGQPLLKIADLNQFRAKVYVVESSIAGVEVKKKVSATLEAFPGRTFEGQIEQVDNAARQLHREDPRKYFSCEVSLDVPTDILDRLKPGMRLAAKNALVLPKSAVIKKENHFVVFVRRSAQYSEQEVRIVDSDHGFYVVEGPKAGDEVCLRHPFEKERLHLPDFNAPSAPTQSRRFVVFF